MITDYKNGILSFEKENEEKIFCVIGTIYGDGNSFSRFMTEKEIEDEGWSGKDGWSKDFNELEIGETSTYGYWFYDKANIVVRVA